MGGEELAVAARSLATDFADSAEQFGAKAEEFIGKTADQALENGRALDTVDQDVSGKLADAGNPLSGADAAPTGDAAPVEGAPTPGGSPGSVDPPAVNTPASPVSTSGVGPCGKVGEPIDVVGGQMVAQTVDARLNGVLGLVLRRAYASGYRDGRLFGPGWASTLDMRVVIETNAVRLLDDDARILE
jgi:hypothetical protein